jgi:hypothetical protein
MWVVVRFKRTKDAVQGVKQDASKAAPASGATLGYTTKVINIHFETSEGTAAR